jgi:hypothetical protein
MPAEIWASFREVCISRRVEDPGTGVRTIAADEDIGDFLRPENAP